MTNKIRFMSENVGGEKGGDEPKSKLLPSGRSTDLGIEKVSEFHISFLVFVAKTTRWSHYLGNYSTP
jgi:hypothetical protein